MLRVQVGILGWRGYSKGGYHICEVDSLETKSYDGLVVSLCAGLWLKTLAMGT